MIVWIAGIAVALIVLVLLGLVLFTWWTAHQVETNLPPRGKFIDIDGVRLHYIDKGSGPTLLLIHGLAGQVLNFTHSLLGRLTRDFRVVILDRPGSGYSLRPDATLAPLAAQARIISRFCQALGPERPVPESVPPPFDGLAIGSPLLRRLIAWTVATPLAIANSDARFATCRPQQLSPFRNPGRCAVELRPALVRRRVDGRNSCPTGPRHHAGPLQESRNTSSVLSQPRRRPRSPRCRLRGLSKLPAPILSCSKAPDILITSPMSTPPLSPHRVPVTDAPLAHRWSRIVTPEHFDVIIVGADSPASTPPIIRKPIAPGRSYVILENRDAIGGTWDLFRYPGIRSDSDMYTFGYCFGSWQSDWGHRRR